MAKIIVAVDGSEYSRKAVLEAKKFFGCNCENEIILVNSQTPLSEPGIAHGHSHTATGEELGRLSLQILTAIADADLKDVKAKVIKKTLWGDPAQAIIEYSNKINSDYIIMGSLGLTGLKRLLIGSVSAKVVRHAKGTIMVVK
jgi:nucleotide-binding universal stress UspA family protein